jgi:predicted DNA-binding protein with PD1-like motif
MKVFEHSGSYTVVVDRGEELMAALAQFAQDQGIGAASVVGIGALEQVTVGYFNLAEQAYEEHHLSGEYELLSLLGNITVKDGAPFVHAHAVLSGANLACVGGHLFSGVVAVTAEVQITVLPAALVRVHDEDTGLFLIGHDQLSGAVKPVRR